MGKLNPTCTAPHHQPTPRGKRKIRRRRRKIRKLRKRRRRERLRGTAPATSSAHETAQKALRHLASCGLSSRGLRRRRRRRGSRAPRACAERPESRVALTPRGCQIGYMCDQNSTYGFVGCTHSRGVSDWLHGDHTGCHRLDVFLLQNNASVKWPTLPESGSSGRRRRSESGVCSGRRRRGERV
jgi:hypothetical protein